MNGISAEIFTTLHLLSYVDAESFRRAIKRMRNLQEGRHGLGKYVFHGRRGELREPYHAGMEDQLGALGIVINCITSWNTVYLDAILDLLRTDGFPVLEADLARLSPYMYAHVNVHGHYTFTAPSLGDARRPSPNSAKRSSIGLRHERIRPPRPQGARSDDKPGRVHMIAIMRSRFGGGTG